MNFKHLPTRNVASQSLFLAGLLALAVPSAPQAQTLPDSPPLHRSSPSPDGNSTGQTVPPPLVKEAVSKEAASIDVPEEFLLPSPTDAAPIIIKGLTEPHKDVSLSLTVPGKVEEIFFREGAWVKKNDIILTLDSRWEALEVSRKKLFWQSKVKLEAAQERERLQGHRYQAQLQLFQSSRGLSEEDLEKQKLQWINARAEYGLEKMTEEEEELGYRQAMETLEKRRLRAPFDGIVSELAVEEGEGVEPNKKIAHLVDPVTCFFVCDVEESQGALLKEGQGVTLAFPGSGGPIRKPGEIVFLSPVVDAASGLRHVRIRFSNATPPAIHPGIAGDLELYAVGSSRP
ncbi:MAG: efflux RND transporter periplasmic adaptor subunit [Nitrospirae bacterium]|nr:efflux RND transporter periplasmic adaptor subunit [Magnetococcales bacterium]HAT49406.1 hypothetical protein [Alphaproteobacteria bacterium]